MTVEGEPAATARARARARRARRRREAPDEARHDRRPAGGDRPADAVWSPHGHAEAVDALLHLAQVVLIDSVNEPDAAAALKRARELSEDAYVVDLAWLRARPWRERVAATFDPPRLRDDWAGSTR